jgi:hypothetical protein
MILLFPLLVIEGYLCMAFLPMQWQLALQRFLPQSHDYTDITHPELGHEIDEFLRTHSDIKIIFYAFLLFLLFMNSSFILLIWKKLRRERNSVTAV